MRDILVKDILNITKSKLITGNENIKCINFVRDSRIVKKGDIYIGIQGDNCNGNIFWKEALENGASCVIVQDIDFSNEDLEKYNSKAIIQVENTLDALYEIASFKRKLHNIPIIAVTGSVGKTSTKDIIANIVSQKYKTLKTLKNHNNNIGLPFTLLRLKDEEVAVLEMGMNHLGEISLLSKIAKPDICVITNIGTSHIGNLGSRENILKAKLEILDGTKNPKIIINNDNDLLHNWYEENKNEKQIYTYSINNANNIKINKENSQFEYDINGIREKIKVPVPGEHFILNSLCGIIIGEILKIEKEKIIKGIETFELTKNRMEIKDTKNNIKIINDAYNASFESMSTGLKNLSAFKENRKIAILGDMFELGDYSIELHQKVGEEVAKNNIDILICSGENAKYIVDKAKEKGVNPNNIYYFKDKQKILNKIKEISKTGDVILLKASNGMKFFELGEKLTEIL